MRTFGEKTSTGMSRRAWLASGLAVMMMPFQPGDAWAKPLQYILRPIAIAQGIWRIYGADEPITAANGGAIANVTIIETTDGTVLIDAGPYP